MASQTGIYRSLVYLFDTTQPNPDPLALPNNTLIVSLMSNAANYLVQAVTYRYFVYNSYNNNQAQAQNAYLYEFFLTTTGDANFTSANLATLQSQLPTCIGLATWSSNITYGV